MTVYIIQDQQTRDRNTGALASRFDISAAETYGDFKFLLGSSARPFQPDHILDQLREGLVGYKEEDHLLLIGNPNFMLWIGMILADMEINTVRTLQWNMGDGNYREIIADVSTD